MAISAGQPMYSFLTGLMIGSCIFAAVNAVGPQVNTTVGMIEGSVKTVILPNVTRDINIFLGVPYAEPPVGDSRFKLSGSKTRISGLYNATDFGAMCPQDKEWLNKFKSMFPPSAFNMDEDCLYLNIYAPVAGSSGSSPKTTMIYIHGGAYVRGTANYHDGSAMAAIGDVVVVTINYRLGALGFLSTETDSVDGNFGFSDQYLAIKWVSDNIEKFGGDKEDITLFGESAGASSVALHSISARSASLFKRVILESGSALNPWTLATRAKVYSTKISAYSGCDSDLKKLYDCLRTKTVADMLLAQKNVSSSLSSMVSVGPVVDKSLIHVSPADVLRGVDPLNVTKTFAAIDHLIGVNSQEGAFIYNGLMAGLRNKINDSIIGLPKQFFDLFVVNIAKGISENYSKIVSSAIDFQYTDHSDENNGFKMARNIIKVLSDTTFYDGILKWTKFQARSAQLTNGTSAGRTYFYLYEHSASWVSTEPWRDGADHADELPLVFGSPVPLTDDEKELSTTIMTYWTNFAKSGDPNLPNPVTYPATWPKYVIGDESYIRLTTDKAASNLIGKKLFADRMAFWGEFLPTVLSSIPTQTPIPQQPCPTTKKPTGGTGTIFLSFCVFFTTMVSGLLLTS